MNHIKSKYTFIAILLLQLISYISFAQNDLDEDVPVEKTSKIFSKKIYPSTGMDGLLLSSTLISNQLPNDAGKTVRLSAFLNYGCTLNLDFNKHVNVFTGIGVKNIGFLEKRNDSTIKFRSYNIGVPFGMKFGNMEKKKYFFFGGGVDFPINFKEKEFATSDELFHRRIKKTDEWLSERTALFMPYTFIGAAVGRNVTFKLQYYISNFFNPDYTSIINGISTKPYINKDVQIIYLSAGIDIDYGKTPVVADDSDY